MIKGHLPYFPLAAAQGLILVVLNLLKQQNVYNDQKQVIQEINKNSASNSI
jgi:hypothetical protein